MHHLLGSGAGGKVGLDDVTTVQPRRLLQSRLIHDELQDSAFAPHIQPSRDFQCRIGIYRVAGAFAIQPASLVLRLTTCPADNRLLWRTRE